MILRMRAPFHRRTEKIGACFADPFADGKGAEETDTFTIPERPRSWHAQNGALAAPN
jgi:hypothetical protein